jgi:hypothetical protein
MTFVKNMPVYEENINPHCKDYPTHPVESSGSGFCHHPNVK